MNDPKIRIDPAYNAMCLPMGLSILLESTLLFNQALMKTIELQQVIISIRINKFCRKIEDFCKR